MGSEVVGRTVLEAVSGRGDRSFVPLLDKVYATGRPFVGRALAFRLPDEDGVLRDGFMNVSYHPFREASGEIRGVLRSCLT